MGKLFKIYILRKRQRLFLFDSSLGGTVATPLTEPEKETVKTSPVICDDLQKGYNSY